MTTSGLIRLAIEILGLVSGAAITLFAVARSVGRQTTRIDEHEKRLEVLESRDPVARPLCDTRVSEYRSTLSDAMKGVYEEIASIRQRLDQMDRARDKKASERQEQLSLLQKDIGEIRVAIAEQAAAMNGINKIIELFIQRRDGE